MVKKTIPHRQIHLNTNLQAVGVLWGDMNPRNMNWGTPNTNSKGHMIEKLIKDHELCLWNDGNPTFIHPATGSFSAIDLSICSPSMFMDFNWVVHDDLCGSDQLLNIHPDGISKKLIMMNLKINVNQN